MKKFCSGDVVPGWPPVSEDTYQRTLQDALASILFQHHSLIRAVPGHQEDRSFDLQEASAA